MAGSIRIEVCNGDTPAAAEALAERLAAKRRAEDYAVVICQTRARTVVSTVTAAPAGSANPGEPIEVDGDPQTTTGSWIVLAIKE